MLSRRPRSRPLPLLRVLGSAAARRPGQQRRATVGQRQQHSPGVDDPYRQGVATAGRPGGGDGFVEVLRQAVASRGGLGSDGRSGGRGGERRLLAGQRRGGAPADVTLAAVFARLVALLAHRVVEGRPQRLQTRDALDLDQPIPFVKNTSAQNDLIST